MIQRSTEPRITQTQFLPKFGAALCFALLLILSFGGFAQSEVTAVNPARDVAESAVEIALRELSLHGTNLIAHGWTAAADGNAVREQVSGDAKYRLTVSFLREPLLIRSEGWVKSPEQTEFSGRPYAMLAEAIPAPYLDKAISTTGDIDLNGSNLVSDSYDSTDPNFSTGGQYDPAKSKDSGDIATNASLLDSIGLTNLKMFGRLAVGPEATFTLGPTCVIGSKAWHAAGQPGIEPGWFTNGMSAQFQDVQAPFVVGLPPLVMPHGKTLGAGDYVEVGSLNMSGSQKLLVTGHARLYVKGNITFTGSSQIEIQPGASLELYVGGSTANIGGNGVRNLTGNPHKFTYYGLNGNTSLSILPASNFIGTIYAPHASLVLRSGGTVTDEVSGAIIAQSLTLNGHFNLHHDESLARTNYIRGKTTHPPSRPSAPRLTSTP